MTNTTPASIGADAERAAFERWLAANQPAGCVSDIERGWQARAALASAAQPACPPECWCEACDTAANNGWRTRMSLCPQCGDKRCPRAEQHDNPCRARGAKKKGGQHE